MIDMLDNGLEDKVYNGRNYRIKMMAARKNLGLTLEALAVKADISITRARKIENCMTTPKTEELKAICKVLSIENPLDVLESFRFVMSEYYNCPCFYGDLGTVIKLK